MAAEAPRSRMDRLQKLNHWLTGRPYLALTLAVLAILGPFLTKPFNVDDPLFLWAARQIQAHPANPYGFGVNWYVFEQPMWQVTENPPLACYYLAGAAAVLGWSEFTLHLAFLLPAIAAILGTYRLALRFCGRPLFAAGVTLFTPVFLVSSTTVMCDVLMLAFWIWAVVFWVEGLECDDLGKLALSGLLIALAALTKYYGACLVPLMATYSIVAKRRLGPWLAALFIPVAALAAYEIATRALYGVGMLSAARVYVEVAKSHAGIADKAFNGLIALTFTGGCLAVIAFLSPFLWRGWQLALLAGGACLIAVPLFLKGMMVKHCDPMVGSSPLFVEAQIIFWAIGGMSVLGLAAADLWRQRDEQSYLLVFWVFGTFIFTAFCNWCVNGRSILPLVPAVAILAVRHLERRSTAAEKAWPRGITAGLAVGALVAVLVEQADCQMAHAARLSAEATEAKYRHGTGTLWFEGHWGFQYYLGSLGAKISDTTQPAFKQGDYLAIPYNNSYIIPPQGDQAQFLEIMNTDGPSWLSTLNKEVGAGFYASTIGPLPFALGRVPPERVIIYQMGPAPRTNEPSVYPVRLHP
jgi:4-amino-4-deoxy-L-arabinose transferase-like glycosyltransferase